MESGYTGDVTNVPERFVDSLIDSFRPDRIVVGCSIDETGEHMCIEAILIATGEKHSIKTVQITEMWDVWFPRREPAFASTYAAIDEYSRAVLAARGAPPDRIEVTGNPGLDGYAHMEVNRRAARRQELGLADDERVLVYYGQAEVADGSPCDSVTLGWVIDSMRPEDRLIFAPHPRDRREYGHILERADGSLVDSTSNSDQLLWVADVCLTHYSTMALKSALLNIPTVNLLLEDDLPDVREICGGFPLNLAGGSYEANTSEELKGLLAGQLAGNASKVKAVLNVDGESAARIAQTVIGKWSRGFLST